MVQVKELGGCGRLEVFGVGVWVRGWCGSRGYCVVGVVCTYNWMTHKLK